MPNHRNCDEEWAIEFNWDLWPSRRKSITAASIGFAILALLLFILMQPRPAQAAEHPSQHACELVVTTELAAGDQIVPVQGPYGSDVNLYDVKSGTLLGSSILSTRAGETACGMADINLLQPLEWAQGLYFEATIANQLVSDTYYYVAPPAAPHVEIYPSCAETLPTVALVVGTGWEDHDEVTLTIGADISMTLPITNSFVLTGAQILSLPTGTHPVILSAGDDQASTLFDYPCPEFETPPFIEGTVYIESADTGWLPVSDALVTLGANQFGSVDQQFSASDGSFQFEVEHDVDWYIYACYADDTGSYFGSNSMLTGDASDADLFLERAESGTCQIDVWPEEPVDLVVGTPTIQYHDEWHWELSVTISNTSTTTVTDYFYVDVFATDAMTPTIENDGVPIGWTYVDGIGANASAELTIDIHPDALTAGQTTLGVMVDSADFIYELNETNNVATLAIAQPVSLESLAIYLLAFDNPQFSTGNLAPQLPETLAGIEAATADDPNKVAVVLADLDEDGDTQIIVVHNGASDYVAGLPDVNGELSGALKEYDMGDGATLGGFLRWARQAWPAQQNTLFVYGHGGPLVPNIDITDLYEDSTASRAGGPIPLPSWVTSFPDLTDVHPVSMLTPVDMAMALEISLQGGAKPYDLVDLVHCFSLSIEEANEIAPYTEAIAGSPNYAYFDAILPGKALEQIETTMTSAELAEAVIDTYDNELPATGYPRQLVAVEAAKLLSIKWFWNVVSTALLDEFSADAAGTRTRLRAAYDAAQKYDTSYCEPDWALSEPDALVDMHDFAVALAEQYPTDTIGIFATQAAESLAAAVIAQRVNASVPEFVDGATASWSFEGLGISMYADLAGVSTDDGVRLNYLYDYYRTHATSDNPTPYDFLQGSNAVSWADVLQAFWSDTTVSTKACLNPLPQSRDNGELVVSQIINPKLGEAFVGLEILPSAVVSSSVELRNAMVQFSIEQNGSVVFSDTVPTRRIAGENWIAASKSWTPAEVGVFELTVTIDPDNYIIESNETDNVKTFSDTVLASGTTTTLQPTSSLVDDQQWVSGHSAPVEVAIGRQQASTHVNVTVYQFEGMDQGVGVGNALQTDSAATSGGSADVALPETLQPGPVELHVWSNDASGRSRVPGQVRFNYVPAHAPIAAGQLTCYPFSAEKGDHLQFQLNVSNADDVNLFIWYPYSFDAPDVVATRPGDDQVLIASAPLSGEYQLCLLGESADGATYTLSVVENGSALFAHSTADQNDAAATVPTSRVLLQSVTPVEPNTPMAVALLTAPVAQTSMALMTLLVTLWLALMTGTLLIKRI